MRKNGRKYTLILGISKITSLLVEGIFYFFKACTYGLTEGMDLKN